MRKYFGGKRFQIDPICLQSSFEGNVSSLLIPFSSLSAIFSTGHFAEEKSSKKMFFDKRRRSH